jgi:hypothetical protein
VSDVRLQRNLKVPPVPAYRALQEILRGIAGQEGVWRGFGLHVALGDLHLPDVGDAVIPIRLTVGETEAVAHSVEVTFTAANNPSSFPSFSGAFGIDATGPSGSILWLGGGYDVPLHV